jgi:hypothetical protein
MAPRRGDYGVDSPYVPAGLGTAALAGFAAAAIFAAFSHCWLAGTSLVVGVVFALSTLSFLWTTRRGKFHRLERVARQPRA